MRVGTPLRRRPRLEALGFLRGRPGEFAVLLAFAVWSLVPFVPVVEAWDERGGVLTGAVGSDAYNQFQYQAWIREASEHLLISNPFGLQPTYQDFLHPMYLLSGILHRAGLDIQLAYLLWRPVAILVLVGGFAAYARHLFPDRAAQRLATLALAVFYFTPAMTFLSWIGEFDWGGGLDLVIAAREVSASRLTWGTDHTAMAVGLMPLYLLSAERLLRRSLEGEVRVLSGPAALTGSMGLLASWLHPAQGATLLLILLGLVLTGRGWRRYRVLALPFAATLAPLVYLKILTWTDPSWSLASQTSEYPLLPTVPLLLSIGPIALFALIGLPGRWPRSDGERMLLLWPLAAAAIYFVNKQFPPHAFNGLSLPLAVLAVRGWSRLRLPALVGVAALAVGTVLVMIDTLNPLRHAVRLGGPLYVLTDPQHDALRFLAGSSEGGVLARSQLSLVVPAFSGHHVWVGHHKWTPDHEQRSAEADAFFNGQVRGREALEYLAEVGVTFVLSDCGDGRAIRRELRRASQSVRSFGCVTVFKLDLASLPRPHDSAAGAPRGTAVAGACSRRGASPRSPRSTVTRLTRSGARESVVLRGGRRITLDPGAMRGFVEAISADGSTIDLRGWAVDPVRPTAAPRVLAFADGKLLVAGSPSVERQDAAATMPGARLRSGYRLTARVDGAERTVACARIRVLATADGRAAELSRLRPTAER